MIVHTVGTYTHREYDWSTVDDEPIVVRSATFTIDGDTVDLLDLSGDYPIALHIPADHAIDAGVYTYRISAVDDANGDTSDIAAGVLRVRTIP